MTEWLEFLDANQNRFEDELMEFVRIPSVSASSDYSKDVERALSE